MEEVEKQGLWVMAVIMMIILSIFTGYYFGKGKASFDEEAAIARLEWYTSVWTANYGKPDCKFAIGGEECDQRHEQIFRSYTNFINVPTELWDENLTVNRAIGAYNQYKPVSKFMSGLILRDICTQKVN